MCNNSFFSEAVTHAAASALQNTQQVHEKPWRQRAWSWRHGGVKGGTVKEWCPCSGGGSQGKLLEVVWDWAALNASKYVLFGKMMWLM